MALRFDRQLWRLFHQDITTYDVAWRLGPCALVLALLLWAFVERRSRGIWRAAPGPLVALAIAAGPYRAARVRGIQERAPISIRLTALAGVVVGVAGLVWPILLIADLEGGVVLAWPSLLIELIGTLSAALSLLSAFALLRDADPFTTREARLLQIASALLAGLGAGYLLHAFDSIAITTHGIKWRETTTLGAFVRSGFNGIVNGHMGVAWRILLRGAALFALMSATYFTLWARLIRARASA